MSRFNITPDQLFMKIGRLTVTNDMLTAQLTETQRQLRMLVEAKQAGEAAGADEDVAGQIGAEEES